MLRPSRAIDPSERRHPTRQKLIEEAARQINEGGIEGVNVDRVLENVGVTKGSLYHHFTSVNDLFIAGLLHAFEAGVRESMGWAISMRQDCLTATQARDRIREVISVSHVAERRPSRSLRVHALSLCRTQPQLSEEVARLQAELTNTVTEVFDEMQKKGWIRPDIDVRAFAVLIQAMTLGRIVDDVVHDEFRVDARGWISLTSELAEHYFVVED